MIILKKASDWNKPNWVEAFLAKEDELKQIGIIEPTKEGIKIQIPGCDGNPKGLEERITIDKNGSQILINLLN